MPGAEDIHLDEQTQKELESLAASRTSAVRSWERAKIILGLASGKAKKEIAEQLGIARQSVLRWEQRFLQLGTEGLKDAPRPGRPSTIGPEKIAQIVYKTVQETPCDSTHWSTRSLAQETEVSASSVSRIWRACKLRPHRVKTFKLSNDPHFAEKTTDVVTLYLLESTSRLGGVVGGRTVSDPGAHAHPVQPALLARLLCDPDAQL
jgi:transposase